MFKYGAVFHEAVLIFWKTHVLFYLGDAQEGLSPVFIVIYKNRAQVFNSVLLESPHSLQPDQSPFIASNFQKDKVFECYGFFLP